MQHLRSSQSRFSPVMYPCLDLRTETGLIFYTAFYLKTESVHLQKQFTLHFLILFSISPLFLLRGSLFLYLHL